MTAKKARSLFFEDYVEFEHNLRDLCKRIDLTIKTKDQNLNDIILKIKDKSLEKDLNINIKNLKINLKMRNWLAHSRIKIKAPKKYILNMKNIKNLNNEIKLILKNKI